MYRTILLILACLLSYNFSFSTTIYVDQNAGGANNGTSWADAFLDLQSALAVVVFGDEIWVAEGTYYPTSTTDRNISFQMRSGVDMYGGFSGTEVSLTDRDWRQHTTVLSGDIGIPNDTIDNTISVVVGPSGSQPVRLDGFLIRDGNAGSSLTAGGGFRASNGISVVVISNCIFLENLSDQGGAMNFVLDNIVIANCAFLGNRSRQYGGISTISDGTLHMVNCIASGNSADVGGGLYLSGGALGSGTHEAWIYNSSFYGNHASTAGGDVATVGNSSANIYNSIFWNSTAGILAPSLLEGGMGDTILPHNSIVEGGYPGSSVLNLDPLFVDPDGADNLLGTLDDDLHLTAGSPAIDAGNSSWIPNDSGDVDLDGDTAEDLPIDLDGEVRVQNNIPDLGAYEYGTTIHTLSGLPENLSFEVFPQPASKNFQVAVDLAKNQEMIMKLVDQKGQIVWESQQRIQAGKHQIEVNASLSTGIYILILAGEDRAGVRKVVVD